MPFTLCSANRWIQPDVVGMDTGNSQQKAGRDASLAEVVTDDSYPAALDDYKFSPYLWDDFGRHPSRANEVRRSIFASGASQHTDLLSVLRRRVKL